MESEKTPEPDSLNPEIDRLPEQLGFIETDELKLLRVAAQEAYKAGEVEETTELRNHFHLVGEEVVNRLQGEEYTKAQIGLMVSHGTLRRDTGEVNAYIDDLEDAWMYALNMGYEDVISAINSAKSQAEKLRLPSSEIADVLKGFSEAHGLDIETCAEIASQPFEEAFQTAYSYLTQAGLDADEILARFTEAQA